MALRSNHDATDRLPLVFAWHDRHRGELCENWERLRRGEAPVGIAPLQHGRGGGVTA